MKPTHAFTIIFLSAVFAMAVSAQRTRPPTTRPQTTGIENPVASQSGGPYAITQSVIANGGGSSDGGSYSITGTTAQNIAGVQSSNSSIEIRGGFWQFFLTPTAASVSVMGRVVDSAGRPISGVSVSIEGAVGIPRSTRTTTFGYFTFNDIEVGRTYLLSASHRRYSFVPTAIVLTDTVADIEIVALP